MNITKLPKPVYLNNWADFIDMVSDFNGLYMSSSEYHKSKSAKDINPYMADKVKKMTALLESDDFKDVNVILASYGSDNYAGDAFVLFEQNGTLYEVHGSHCSCYGLEEQWSPEVADIGSLEHRVKNGNLGEDDYSGNVFKPDLVKVIRYIRRHNK